MKNEIELSDFGIAVIRVFGGFLFANVEETEGSNCACFVCSFLYYYFITAFECERGNKEKVNLVMFG